MNWARRLAWLVLLLAAAFAVLPYQARRDEGRVRTRWCAPAPVTFVSGGLCGDESRRRLQGAVVVAGAAGTGVLFTRRRRRGVPTIALGVVLIGVAWSSVPFTTAEAGAWRASCPPALVSYPKYQDFDGLMTECYDAAGLRLLWSGALVGSGAVLFAADALVIGATRVVRRTRSA